jgi:ABC-2 type transport system ATP-binding protein
LEKILSIRNLNKSFGLNKAVNNLNLEIEKGNVYGILGPNGSGKSTTLGIVLNVVNKTSGEFDWFDGKLNTHEALKKVGAIIERPNFYPYMSAEENLRLVCDIKNINYLKIDEKLQVVGLLERKNDKFRTYSLGMKQRLAIASALLNDPEILILDEPTNGLDPQGIRQIRDIIQQIAAKGTTILLASHLLDEVEKVCTHVIVLNKGVMLYNGKVDEMMSSEGFFELNAKNLNLLKENLTKLFEVKSIQDQPNGIKVFFTNEQDAETVNQKLFQNNIVLTYLQKKKNSLEEQFIQLTNARVSKN